MRILLIILMLMIPGAAFAQRGSQDVNIDQIEDVALNDEGMRVVEFRTRYPGRLNFDVFSAPTSAGEISVTFRARGASGDNEEGKASVAPAVYGAGRYEAVVRAANPGRAIIQMRFTSDIPLDEYESNDSRETATRIELPFRGLVRLSGSDFDWFRVDPPAGGIIGVHLHTDGQWAGPQIAFYGSGEEPILLTDRSEWGHRGMRYVRATGQPVYIAVWDNNNYGEGDVNAFKELEIVQYTPEGAPASARSLVTLGVEEDDPASFQLDLIGRAIGVDTVQANEAEAIAQELKIAIEGRGISLGTILLWGFAALLLALIGLSVWWQRHRIGQIATRNAAPAEKADESAEKSD